MIFIAARLSQVGDAGLKSSQQSRTSDALMPRAADNMAVATALRTDRLMGALPESWD
jgi:hypothetical protein